MRLQDNTWYDDAPLGKDPLNNMMKILSEEAKLTQIYTNHSIHSTALTILDGNNIASRHIQALSGHECESTIKTYAKKCPPAKREKCSICYNWTNHQTHHHHQKFKNKQLLLSVNHKIVINVNANTDQFDIDFLDFVPVDNNQDDFDLA